MGWKLFGAETLTAEDVNNHLMSQAVIVVDDEAELAAITLMREGMHAYVTDTGKTYRCDESLTWRPVLAQANDWQLVPTISGYTSELYARIEGDGSVVRLRGTVTRGSGLQRATNFATLPANLRPVAPARVAVAIGTDTTTLNTSSCLISTGGGIQLLADSTSLSKNTIAYFDSVTFTIDALPTP